MFAQPIEPDGLIEVRDNAPQVAYSPDSRPMPTFMNLCGWISGQHLAVTGSLHNSESGRTEILVERDYEVLFAENLPHYFTSMARPDVSGNIMYLSIIHVAEQILNLSVTM